MSVLAELHAAAVASDTTQDWRALYQGVAGTALVVPLSDAGGLALADDGGVQIARVYLSVEAFAAGLAQAAGYAELPGADLADLLAGAGVALEITTEDAPILLAADQLRWIADTYGAEVTRAMGAGVRVTTPAPPELVLMEALGQTVGALGTDCPEAWLVEMAEAGAEPELVLVMGLSDAVQPMEGQIAETVTRAIQSVTDRRFAVACAGRGTPLMVSAREHGIGIGG